MQPGRRTHSLARFKMRTVTVELPDALWRELEAMVRSGWFKDEGEAMRLAATEFLRHGRLELAERFHREDIAWALQERDAPR
jgi:Arc/MetJ-type ribon-helix-helix transcriptional regulator